MMSKIRAKRQAPKTLKPKATSGARKKDGSSVNTLDYTLQMEGIAIGWDVAPIKTKGQQQVTGKPTVNFCFDGASWRRERNALKDPAVALERSAEPGSTPYEIVLKGTVVGKKNRPVTIKFHGGVDGMRAAHADAAPWILRSGDMQEANFYDATVLETELEGWQHYLPPVRIVNLHGAYWKPEKKSGDDPDKCYDPKTFMKVQSMVCITTEAMIPPHFRCPFDPHRGQLGDNAAIFFSDPESPYSSAMVAIPYFNTPTHHCDLLASSVLEKYIPSTKGRAIYHEFGIPGTSAFIPEKVPEQQREGADQTWLSLPITRMENPNLDEDVFEPNHSEACFGLIAKIPRSQIVSGLGISKLEDWRAIGAVHVIPAIIVMKVNKKSTAERNQFTAIGQSGAFVDAPLSECHEPKNGFLVGYAETWVPALAFYLRQNALRVSVATAKKALPKNRKQTDSWLCNPNSRGISCVKSWAGESDVAALNAGSPFPPPGGVQYFALLAIRWEKDIGDGKTETLFEPFSLERLQEFSEMTPEQGDLELMKIKDELPEDKTLVYYVYAVAEKALATEMPASYKSILKHKAWKTTYLPPLTGELPDGEEYDKGEEERPDDEDQEMAPLVDNNADPSSTAEEMPPATQDDYIPDEDAESPASADTKKRGRKGKGKVVGVQKSPKKKGK